MSSSNSSEPNYNNQIPLFHCMQWITDPDYVNNPSIAMSFCLAEKALDLTSLTLFFCLAYQMYVYYRYYKVGFTAFRMIIYLISLISALNTFLHYGIFYAEFRSKTLFLIVILEFVTFFLICYYYTSKASGLLENKKLIIVVLKLIFVISLSIILILGAIIYIKLGKNQI